MPEILTLARVKLAQTLAAEETLDEFGIESVAEHGLDSLSESTCRAIVDLTDKALDEWGCLRQPPGSDWRAVVYPLESECENPILVTVRRERGPLCQLATLTIDANRLVEDQYTRGGAELMIELVEAVLEEANRLLRNASALVSDLLSDAG